MTYRFELMCLSWECEGQTIQVYDGLEQVCKDLGNIVECPECGEEFKVTENHIYVRNLHEILESENKNMHKIDLDSIVKEMDVQKLIGENIASKVSEYIDIGNIVDDALDDEKLKELIHKKVTEIIDDYLLTDDGKNCVIEKFTETISDPDVLIDDRIIDIIVEFLKKSLMERY